MVLINLRLNLKQNYASMINILLKCTKSLKSETEKEQVEEFMMKRAKNMNIIYKWNNRLNGFKFRLSSRLEGKKL